MIMPVMEKMSISWEYYVESIVVIKNVKYKP